MLMELCAEEGSESRGMYLPGEAVLLASGVYADGPPLLPLKLLPACAM